MALTERILFIVIAGLSLRIGRCAFDAEYRCPDAAITENVSEPAIRKTYEEDLTGRVWATGALVPQTPLLAELRDALLEMVASDSEYFSHVAFVHAVSAAALLSQPDLYVSMCPFAKVINDSLAYEKSRNEQTYLQALYEVSSTTWGACAMGANSILAQMGCSNLSEPSGYPRNCYENGFVFCAEEAWSHFGRLMPCTLTDVYFKLYNSSIFEERAHATILAYILTPAQFQLFLEHPPALTMEMMELFVRSPREPRCCCARRRARLAELCLLHNRTVYANAATEAAVANGENCDEL